MSTMSSSGKPGFIRVKLIELDPAPDIIRQGFVTSSSSSSTTASAAATSVARVLKTNSNGLDTFVSGGASSSIDPYCAVNIKELVKIESTSANVRNASESRETSRGTKLGDVLKRDFTTFTLSSKKSKQ